jgi:hypothetical protein
MKLTIKQKVAFHLESLIESIGEKIYRKLTDFASWVGRSVPDEYWEDLIFAGHEDMICDDCREDILHGE